ncbi:GNAT family N-acetyltransferase [Phyllobacterium salinisoli]|uniref:GNAT family N-acetyltransferase n=1 Tax=Phyllobacterium salinisoli TaxID=1899321 RepID=A0A368K0Z2_9HYPH|nr:GNAT family N-acetyltransferase [Phyllobacterium salinisoli]RCS22335.1 GNAT family N-acetyltransferase [Phyllobacterium salinisoli]
MPNKPEEIGFVPVEPGHYPMLRKWLTEPHVREWWGDPEEEMGFIRDMVEGRDTTRPFIMTLNGAPLGYIQYWFLGHHQNDQWTKEHPWLKELPPETVGVDLSIGDPAKLSMGIGSRALGAFVRKLRDEGHETIIIDPDCENMRAVRAYAKAGFKPVPHLQGRTGDTLIMQYSHHPNENPI